MTNRINKVKTRNDTNTAPLMVNGKLSYSLYDSDGNKVGQTLVDPGTDMSTAKESYFKKGDNGLWTMTDIPDSKISVNEETGNIKISAPKTVTDTDQFKQFINEDALKEYSQAYKLNKNYKLQIQEKDEKTGKTETKEITIPDYVDRLNSSLTKYFQNLKKQRVYTRQIQETYGDKSNNMTEAQIVMSAQGAKDASATYLPDTILNVDTFGNGRKNPLVKLNGVVGENGEISAEELEKVWKRDDFGREEVAALMAIIEGHLEQSNWDKDTYYTDADGNRIYNRNSAEEAAKLIAFKNYILNNNPKAEWYQQAGDWIESAAVNFNMAVTNVFANLAVMGEGAIDIIPGVEANAILNWKNESDQTLTNYNAISAQAWDALVNAQIWGYLAGTAAGTIATTVLGKAIYRDITNLAASTTVRARQLVEEAGLVARGSSAWQALTPQTMIYLYESSEAISLGTRLWLAGLSMTNKALMATHTALSAISGAKNMNILTEYLFDTIHDAILYDGSTLRNVIEALQADDSNENRQEAINYWIGQFAENSLYWIPIGVGKASIKLAGKTDIGKAANAVLTKYINKVSAKAGFYKQSIKDKFANGSVTKKLREDIAQAISDNKFTKAHRLQEKLDIENWNANLRNARQRLGDLELEWDGAKLTAKSLEQFQNFVGDIKYLENGIDSFNRDVVNKVNEYTVKQPDPSTGMLVYLNPELGAANEVTTMYYWDLVAMNKKYNLTVAKDSMLSQDVVDFWVNSYYKRLSDSFASSGGVNAAKAQDAAIVLQKNIDDLSTVVPEEIQTYINNMLDRQIYQKWYFAQNQYGMFKGLLNKERTLSYQNNEIWQQNGYMPIMPQRDLGGHWVDNTGRMGAVLEQDTFEALTFNVSEGQHFVDPEMVRQSRLRKMAEAEISKEVFKAYNGFTNSATNITKITGEETSYVDKINRSKEAFTNAIKEDSTKAFSDNWMLEPQVGEARAKVKNETIDAGTRSTVVSSMSPEQTSTFLASKQGGRVLSSPFAKLTDGVTVENYQEWFNGLNRNAQKYIAQQYSELADEASGSNANYKFVTATNDDYPGWSIGEHPVWALDESDNNYDGMTRRDYYRKEKGKEFRVIEMPTNEYNKVMMDDDIGRMLSRSEMDVADTYVEKFKNGERADIPFIEYDKNGKIIGQEGRHRTAAAYKAGIEKTPVVIEYPVGSDLPDVLKKYNDVTDNFVLRSDTSDISGVNNSATPGTRYANMKRAQALINSKENVDFLNKIGWDNGIRPQQSSTAFGRHNWYKSKIDPSSSYEVIKINLDNIDSLPKLKSVEVHELAHAAWLRTTDSTKKAIGQDLVKLIGMDIEIDDLAACSRDMNELVAHAVETRFQGVNGWDLLKNDKVTKRHLTNLAKHAGVQPTEAFKDRVMTILRSFVTFIKTNLLGVNDAKTFDDFYFGLLNGDFAGDLRKSINEIEISKGYNGSLRPKRNLTTLDVPAGAEDLPTGPTKIQVGGPDDLGTDITVSMPRKITIEGLNDPGYEIPVNFAPIDGGDYSMLVKAMERGGDDFEAGLQRAYLIGDKKFAKSSVMNEAAKNLENGKDAFYQGVVLANIKGQTKNIVNLNTDAFWDDMLVTIRGQIDYYIDMVTQNPGARAVMDTLSETTNGSDAMARYLALQQLEKNGLKNAYDVIDEQIEKMHSLDNLSKGHVKLIKEESHILLKDVVETELDLAENAAKIINPDLVDSKDVFAKVKEISKRIEEAEGNIKAGGDYIMYLNDAGQQVYAQVDPAFASLFNTRERITKSEASLMAKVNALASRAFRYGTTSLNLSAFGNQLFRDFGNAILVGGAWQTIKTNADNLKDVFGERIVEQIKAFDPDGYEMRQINRIAEATGQTVEQAAVSRELMRGASIAGTTTETSLYRDFYKQAYGSKKDDLLLRAKGKLEQFWEKYDPDKYMNGKRENYLRNRVYASSLNDAMKEGFSLNQARAYAEFAMNNATTNFARQLYHMQAIAESTPYFRAAINGTKSFWRMWSLDPVGITGRIMGGLIIPVMFLTGASLGSEENRKVYKNIPEYQKTDSLVFVFNGEAVSIPLPQELSPLVSPFRQFVEYLYDANQNDFWELMANDLLGFSPYDITGFTAIDYDKMIDDPTIFDRVSRGFSRLFSQMAPVPLKSAYMIASGTDPYTGKWLRDPSYAYWNEETGTVEIMDEYQSDFATWFAKMFPGTNPAIADKVLSGVFGTTGSNLLSDFTTLLSKGPDAAITNVGEHLFEQATKPITVEQYDLVDSVWKRAVRQLTNEKNALLDSKEMVAIKNKLSQTKDPDERKKLLAQQHTMLDAYTEKVAKMVQRLESEYGGNFDRKKFAAVIQLLNFNSDAPYQSGSQYSSNLASDMYWNGRDEAIHTMERLGITGTNDTSIFGYLTVDSDGNPVMRYSSPTAIMDMKSQWQSQDDINSANIKAILTTNKVYDAHKAISDQISKIYDSKKKLTNQDYANIEAIQINWNAQLMKLIAPYITQMTPEAAINNTQVLNLLYPYVEVPGSWEKNNSGKSVSLGSRGNKKKAYYDSWIKSMFSVNDPYKGQY